MKIAIASGKGGTGKTTVSVALANAVTEKLQYLDCDVEAPNGQLFLNLEDVQVEPVNVLLPKVNKSLCSGCGDCADICQFNAIVSQGQYAMVFPELCHSCGGCCKICPENAITEIAHPIGTLTRGTANHINYIQGRLDIGKAMAPPVIRAVKHAATEQTLTIIDCPPGTSCPMIVSVSDADYILLVTEPTPFGLHDLKLAVQTVRELQRPFAVIINRADGDDDRVEQYCQQEEIPIRLRIPENKRAAQASSRGESIVTVFPDLAKQIQLMLKAIRVELAMVYV